MRTQTAFGPYARKPHTGALQVDSLSVIASQFRCATDHPAAGAHQPMAGPGCRRRISAGVLGLDELLGGTAGISRQWAGELGLRCIPPVQQAGRALVVVDLSARFYAPATAILEYRSGRDHSGPAPLPRRCPVGFGAGTASSRGGSDLVGWNSRPSGPFAACSWRRKLAAAWGVDQAGCDADPAFRTADVRSPVRPRPPRSFGSCSPCIREACPGGVAPLPRCIRRRAVELDISHETGAVPVAAPLVSATDAARARRA